MNIARQTLQRKTSGIDYGITSLINAKNCKCETRRRPILCHCLNRNIGVMEENVEGVALHAFNNLILETLNLAEKWKLRLR
jgi:hypothetical protein